MDGIVVQVVTNRTQDPLTAAQREMQGKGRTRLEGPTLGIGYMIPVGADGHNAVHVGKYLTNPGCPPCCELALCRVGSGFKISYVTNGPQSPDRK